MADNYLERQYEALQRGPRVVRRVGPTLESLLERVTSSGMPVEAADALTQVKLAQLQALVRAASVLEISAPFSFEPHESALSCIIVTGPSSPQRYMLDLGEVLMAMRLKAAELGLQTSVEPAGEGVPGSRLLARLYVFY